MTALVREFKLKPDYALPPREIDIREAFKRVGGGDLHVGVWG